MGQVLAQPTTGGQTGPAGRTGYMELGQPILGRPHEKYTFSEKVHFRAFIGCFRPSRPRQWIQLEILHRMASTRGLETSNWSVS